MRLGVPDASGRRAPEEVEGADYTEAADLVILALGFTPENLPEMWKTPELDTTNWGTITAQHESHATSIAGVYAVGDIVRGASLVVWAIKDGRDAAESMATYLSSQAQVAAE
jgi:glutamate synthase (NADPH/NADH) small chain